MGFTVLGLNHRTAPVEVRERLACSSETLKTFLFGLKDLDGVSEGVILSTCNRVEVYAQTQEERDGRVLLKEFFRKLDVRGGGDLDPFLYGHQETEAVRHAIRVGAGLDAMVVGETQVFGQLKEAFFSATQCGCVGPLFQSLFPRMFNVIKRIHTETGIGQMPGSVSSVAVDLAEKIFGTLAGRTIVVVGAGTMSELTAKSLASRGMTGIFVANRTFERAESLARAVGGTPITMDQLMSHVVKADIVMTSAAAPSWLFTRQAVALLMPQRRYQPLFFIDIAMPRNIEPEVDRVEGVYVYNLDDLQGIASRYQRERERYLPRAEAIVADGVGEIMGWLSGLAVSPVIADLRRLGETVRQEELRKLRIRLPLLSESEYEEIDRFSRAMVSRILRGPIMRVRERAEAGNPEEMIARIREAFAVDGVSSLRKNLSSPDC